MVIKILLIVVLLNGCSYLNTDTIKKVTDVVISSSSSAVTTSSSSEATASSSSEVSVEEVENHSYELNASMVNEIDAHIRYNEGSKVRVTIFDTGNDFIAFLGKAQILAYQRGKRSVKCAPVGFCIGKGSSSSSKASGILPPI